jgi:hypothetical protein
MRQNLLSQKTPHNNKFKPIKLGMKKTRKVLYWLSMSVSDSIIVHIQDVKSTKQAWDTLVKMYNTNIQARKM